MAGKTNQEYKDILALSFKLRRKLEASIGSPEGLPAPHAATDRHTNSFLKAGKEIFQGKVRKTAKGRLKVSIVIPVYNKVEFTYHCLESLSKSPSKYHYEVIV